MEAALTDPKAVIAFATDAAFSTRALPLLDVPEQKILGEWEFEEGAGVSVVQSGVYTIRQRKIDEKTGKNKVKIASRGFTVKDGDKMGETFADAFEREMFVDIPEHWRNGDDGYEFEDDVYMGLGACAISPRLGRT